MWIDDNIILYLFQKQGVQADRLTAALGQSMHSPFGQRLPCLTAYVGRHGQGWCFSDENIDKVEAQNKQILPSLPISTGHKDQNLRLLVK